MRILLLNTSDRGGGAGKVALDLQKVYLRLGHEARLIVKYKKTDCKNIFEIDPYLHLPKWRSHWAKFEKIVRKIPNCPYRIVEWIRQTALPKRWLDVWQGLEDFNYTYAHHLIDDGIWRPDVIHAHNLHGNYFDLGALPVLSSQAPVVWTLHDTWPFTGHCGHPIGCIKWRTGCRGCQHLKRPPHLRRDGTCANWQYKEKIYAKSRLAVVTPSRWLMGQLKQSILQPWHSRVIPNGVDLTVYKPSDSDQARKTLNLPTDSFICVFIAHSGSRRKNPYKDYATVEQALRLLLAKVPNARLDFICIGGDRKDDPNPRWHYTGHLSDHQKVALYYQAADVLLHAAWADNFPLVILEALACGTPVIATAVGGIPEQILEGETGFLVPRGDSELMSQRIIKMMERPDLCRKMGKAAAIHANQAFDLNRQGEVYLRWFHDLLAEYDQQANKQSLA